MGMGNPFSWKDELVVWLMVFLLPLGLWKLVEVLVWLVLHIRLV